MNEHYHLELLLSFV